MTDFPPSTTFDKPIPKTKFYENLPVSPAVKNIFVNEIAGLVWRNKLSPETLNVLPGTRIRELEVFEIALKKELLNDQALKVIDRGIPYHLLFLLRSGEKYMACIGYKELNAEHTESLAVKEYFKTEWMSFAELPLLIEGLTMDEVYDNFIRQINRRLDAADDGSLKDAIQSDAERRKLEQQIAKLEKLAWAEKQPKRKFELVTQIQNLKKLHTAGE
jgi:hypothetical protein